MLPRRLPFLVRAALLVLKLSATFALAACGATPFEGVVEDPSGTPRIVRESTGGIAALRITIEVDSAAATWRRTTCSLPADGGACGNDRYVESGAVDRAAIDRVFAEARTRPFLELPARYTASGQVADGMAERLTITAGGYTRTMTWETGAELPSRLEQWLGALADAQKR